MDNNYFDKTNTHVRVTKYGTSFGKEVVPDKNLIPVPERPNRLAEKAQALTEAVNTFKESSSVVNAKRLEDLKDERLREKMLTEGYANLKDELLKDVMRQICVESMLVDEEVVLENVEVINQLVDTEVDKIGGFTGLQTIATKTHNRLLENMVEMINSEAKKIGDRVLQEAKTCQKMSFEPNPEEVIGFDASKKDLGVDEVTDFVKDRVLNVVQDEQQASEAKGAVMDEIKDKLSNAQTEVPVEEAMADIFDTKGLEELTIFESFMRQGYKNLLETSSSAIFESCSIKEDDDFDDDDDDECDMSDIELDDDFDDDDECDIDDDDDDDDCEVLESIKPLLDTFKSHGPVVVESLSNEDTEQLSEALDKMADDIESISEGCKSRSKAKKVKEACRAVQKNTVEVIDEACKAKSKKVKEAACGKKALNEEDENCETCGAELTEEMFNDEDDIVTPADLEEGARLDSVRLKIQNFFEKQLAKEIAKRDFGAIRVRLEKLVAECKTEKDLDYLVADNKIGLKQLEDSKKRFPDSAEKIDDHIKWLKKEYVALIADRRKAIKSQRLEEATMGAKAKSFKTKVGEFFDKRIYDKVINKLDLDKEKKSFMYLMSVSNTKEDVEYFSSMIDEDIQKIEKAKVRHPDKLGIVDEYIKWMKTECPKLAKARIKEIETKAVKEAFDVRMDAICDKLNEVIDKHENALNLALESLNVNYDGNEICAPMLRAKDCNSSNLEMAYKVKVVCESLKNLFDQTETLEETKQLEAMVDINLNYIAEARNMMIGKSEYKNKLLRMAENYLGKLNKNNGVLAESLMEGLDSSEVECLDAIKQVQDVYDTVTNSELMESTNDEFMEVVLAEAIVKYTIMEAFSTLNLHTYNSEEIRKMAKANIR